MGAWADCRRWVRQLAGSADTAGCGASPVGGDGLIMAGESLSDEFAALVLSDQNSGRDGHSGEHSDG